MKVSGPILALSFAVVLAACSEPTAQVSETDAKDVVKEVAAKTKTAAASEKTQYALTKSDLGQGVYMLAGQGGNIGVSAGADGIFVIDDQFARFIPTILNEIKAISDGPIKFVINTHYHGDHSGGNAGMREAGATIIAHDNVRARMSTSNENKFWGRTVEATAPEAWPALTFSENMTFHFNGQTVEAVHVPNAHTDGDAIIYFREADILHMGDNFFNGMFPYVDIDGGGSVDGMIAALDRGLALAGEKTQIIPGHGPMSSKADMKAARDMLADVQARVKKHIDSGKKLDAILAENPLEDYAQYAAFINQENMIKIAYRSLTGQLE